MTSDQIIQIADAGGKLIVSPHSDQNLVTAAKARGLFSLPGVATPSEGFAALNTGADGLKLFPAEFLSPPVVKAWRAVMDRRVGLFPVGGITPDNIEDYWDAGATEQDFRAPGERPRDWMRSSRDDSIHRRSAR